MLKHITILFLLLFPLLSIGQSPELSDKIYYGANISLGTSSFSTLNKRSFAPLFEIGGFINSKATETISFNFSLNLSLFAEHSREYNNEFILNNLNNLLDSVISVNSGSYKHEVAMISVPLRIEHIFDKNKNLGFFCGVTPRFRLYDNMSEERTTTQKNRYTDTIISQTNYSEENLKHRFFKLDVLHFGVLYKINKWKISAFLGNGDFIFKNTRDHSNWQRLDFQLELSYQIN
ncbi:MAG: hypothetical protein AB8F74_05460 [Saprospiraceae bacterium]